MYLPFNLCPWYNSLISYPTTSLEDALCSIQTGTLSHPKKYKFLIFDYKVKQRL